MIYSFFLISNWYNCTIRSEWCFVISVVCEEFKWSLKSSIFIFPIILEPVETTCWPYNDNLSLILYSSHICWSNSWNGTNIECFPIHSRISSFLFSLFWIERIDFVMNFFVWSRKDEIVSFISSFDIFISISSPSSSSARNENIVLSFS